MNTVKSLIISVCGMYILQFVISILSPNKYKALIKSVLSLLIVGAVLGGLPKIKLEPIFDMPNEYTSISTAESDKLVLEQMNKRLEAYLSELLESNNIITEKTIVRTTIDKDRCIQISEVKVIISDEYQNHRQAVLDIIAKNMGDLPVEVTVTEE